MPGTYYYIKKVKVKGKEIYCVFSASKYFDVSKFDMKSRYHTKQEADKICSELNCK